MSTRFLSHPAQFPGVFLLWGLCSSRCAQVPPVPTGQPQLLSLALAFKAPSDLTLPISPVTPTTSHLQSLDSQPGAILLPQYLTLFADIFYCYAWG